MNFFTELKRRNALRAAGLYAAGAWLLVQGATQVFPLFHVAERVMRWIVLASVIGFPFVVIFSWFDEWTSHGFKLESEMAPNESITRRSGRKLDRWIIAFLSLAVILLLANQLVLHRDENKSVDTASTAKPIAGRSSAVPPFENLSSDKDNAYFVSGMQDMILTKLSGIGDLKVISRTSTEKYKSHPDDLKVVGEQLGVATILEGSVQKSGNQVLINLQLIDAASDDHLWADAYPRTLENIFGVEGEVAQKVANALKANLTPVETAPVAKPPTQNVAAYDLFLRAEYQAKLAEVAGQESIFAAAEDDYREAIALDPNFALAYAKLAYIQLNRQWTLKNLTKEELAIAKTSIDRALALAPNLPEAHLGLGSYEYWGFRRYSAAVAEFRRTLQLAPSNARALAGLAFMARRTGDWQGSLTYFAKVLLVAGLFGFGDVEGSRKAYQSPPEWRIAADQFTATSCF